MRTEELRNGLEMFARDLVLHQQQLCTFGHQNFAVRVKALAERYRILRTEVEARLVETETVGAAAAPNAPAIVLPSSATPPRRGKGERPQ